MGMEKTAYLVTGDDVWEMDESGELVQDEPQNIGTIWPGLPRYPDAGFTWLNGLQYLFIGTTFSGFREFNCLNLSFLRLVLLFGCSFLGCVCSV